MSERCLITSRYSEPKGANCLETTSYALQFLDTVLALRWAYFICICRLHWASLSGFGLALGCIIGNGGSLRSFMSICRAPVLLLLGAGV
jgi:hypothetical protein